MKKILAHLIRLNSSQFNERFKRFTIWKQKHNVDNFSGLSLKRIISWNWCWFRRFTLVLIKTKKNNITAEWKGDYIYIRIVSLRFIFYRLSW
jgi:hypothetical protein